MLKQTGFGGLCFNISIFVIVFLRGERCCIILLEVINTVRLDPIATFKLNYSILFTEYIMDLVQKDKMIQLQSRKNEPWINPKFTKGLVSVIMGTYNHAHLIKDSLDSVWQQNYRPIELIIVNDGSEDKTEEIVKRWMPLYNTYVEFAVKYFRQKNLGVCTARNLALKESTGEFIQFLDSDDLIHIDRFEKVVSFFNKTGCEYIETGFEGFCKERGDSDERHYGHVKHDQLDKLLQGMLWPNTLRPMYRRSLIIKTGSWNESMKTFQDYEYIIRALVQAPKIKTQALHEILASARRDHGPRMSDIFKTHEGRELRIYCESVLCDRVKKCDYIKKESKQALASRLYALGFRSNASGWPDLGKRCAELADSLGVNLDMLGKRRKLVCRTGKLGGLIYQWFAHVKNSMSVWFS